MSGYYCSSFLVAYDRGSITKTMYDTRKNKKYILYCYCYPPTQPLSVLIYLVIRIFGKYNWMILQLIAKEALSINISWTTHETI